ncbi:hypothetical protein J3R30DRAFT_3413936 [Lentinula aciculospora]|uniref:Uncharacterized protein n=1 Tax=Lentinula aciculospora TaxID=153920 RepID=A0A9W9DDX4_9AGAR|nr:hypothetical protein J3R30DRAFT_3413936 [Lentinula aciculospora]
MLVPGGGFGVLGLRKAGSYLCQGSRHRRGRGLRGCSKAQVLAGRKRFVFVIGQGGNLTLGNPYFPVFVAEEMFSTYLPASSIFLSRAQFLKDRSSDVYTIGTVALGLLGGFEEYFVDHVKHQHWLFNIIWWG